MTSRAVALAKARKPYNHSPLAVPLSLLPLLYHSCHSCHSCGRREREAAQRAGELTQRALEAEKKLLAAMK